MQSPTPQIRCSKCDRLLTTKPGLQLGALVQCTCGAVLRLTERERNVIVQTLRVGVDTATLIPYVGKRRNLWKWLIAVVALVGVCMLVVMQAR
jgi:hypothetical protein